MPHYSITESGVHICLSVYLWWLNREFDEDRTSGHPLCVLCEHCLVLHMFGVEHDLHLCSTGIRLFDVLMLSACNVMRH